jgi:hypothetical protein
MYFAERLRLCLPLRARLFFLCTLCFDGAPASAYTMTGAAISDAAAIAHIARAIKPAGWLAIFLLHN